MSSTHDDCHESFHHFILTSYRLVKKYFLPRKFITMILNMVYSAILFFSQEKRYSESCAHFNTVLQVQGYRADTCYCIALCHYNLRQYATALKYITEIIERGIKDYPGTVLCLKCIHTGENSYQFCHLHSWMDYYCLCIHLELSVGMQTEGVDIRSVGNTAVSQA